MPPRNRPRGLRLTAFLLVTPLLLALLAVAAQRLLVDRWWLALPLGYGPRWIWWPLVLLPFVAWRATWRARLTMAATIAAVVGFLLVGFEIPTLRSAAAEASPRQLRVMTFNAAVSRAAARTAALQGAGANADVILVVECSLKRDEGALPGYHAYKSGEVCLWTQEPIDANLENAPRNPRTIGWSGTIARVTVTIRGEPVTIGIVHLRSVRDELTEFLDMSGLANQRETMSARHQKRVAGSEFASQWLAESDIVMGDFNLVVEGTAYRRDWHNWHNAFDRLGWGTGYTWFSNWYGLRIDHVLYHPGRWIATAITVGENIGSDHRPVLVDLVGATP
jgi:endonuclease/exonuclease/phosphatase (EEP) superfamily protein YafD